MKFIKKNNSKILLTIKDNKDHLESSFYLFFINILQFTYPLLLSPMIIRRCGLEGFGIVVFFQAIAIFLSSITDFGFNIIGTREIIKNDDSEHFKNNYFFVVNYTKLVLLIFTIVISIFLYYLLPKANEYSTVFFSSLFIILGRAFNPIWILRALHKMNYFFYFFIFFKIVSFIFLFFFLNDVKDLYIVNFSIGFFDLLTCFFSLFTLFFFSKWKFSPPKYKNIKNEIIIGFNIFIQLLSINANNYLNPVILGFFVNDYYLGFFCIVEKIITTVKFSSTFIMLSVFPKGCELATRKPKSFPVFIKALLTFQIFSMVFSALFLIYFSNQIVSFFSVKEITECSKYLIYNSWIPLIVTLNMSPNLIFMVYEKQKSITHVLVISVFLNTIINSFLASKYGIYGISTGIYITEIFITVSLWLTLIFKFPEYNFFKKSIL